MWISYKYVSSPCIILLMMLPMGGIAVQFLDMPGEAVPSGTDSWSLEHESHQEQSHRKFNASFLAADQKKELAPGIDAERALLSPRSLNQEAVRGSTVKVVIGGINDCLEKPDDQPDFGVAYRPSYNKRIRCKIVNNQETCEECSGNQNCWYGYEEENICSNGKGNGALDKSHLKLTVTAGHGFSRFLNRAYVCSSSTEKVELKATKMSQSGGTLRFKGMGGLQNLNENGADDFSKDWSSGLSDTENELIIEFEPNSSSAGGSASIKEMYFSFDHEAVSCKEKENDMDNSCPLKMDSALLNNNSHQLSCLKEQYDDLTDGTNGKGCKEWRTCLSDSDQYWMKSSLEAGQPDDGSSGSLLKMSSGLQSGHQSGTTTTTTGATWPDCFDPATQSVSDFKCTDCKGCMITECNTYCDSNLTTGTPLSECLAALAWDHPTICQSWKDASNADASTCYQSLRRRRTTSSSLYQKSVDGTSQNKFDSLSEKALSRHDLALMRRDSFSESSAVNQLDKTMTGKDCENCR